MVRLPKTVAALALSAGIAALAVPPASASPAPDGRPATPRREEIESKLSNVKISLEFADAPLAEVLDFIRSFSGIDFFIDPKVREKVGDDQLKVSLKVKDVPLRSALRLILGTKNLTAVYREGVLVVVPKEEADKEVVLRIYDVRDLLMKIEDNAGPVIDLRPPGQKGGTGGVPGVIFDISEKPPLVTEEFIVEMVKKNCGGASWETNPNATVTLNNGLLMVSQTPRVHAEVLRLIGMLRQYK